MKIADTRTLVHSLKKGILGHCGAGKILGEDGHPCVLSLSAQEAGQHELFDLASDTVTGKPTTVAYAPLQDTPGKVEGVMQLFFEEDDEVRMSRSAERGLTNMRREGGREGGRETTQTTTSRLTLNHAIYSPSPLSSR